MSKGNAMNARKLQPRAAGRWMGVVAAVAAAVVAAGCGLSGANEAVAPRPARRRPTAWCGCRVRR
ncbi:hypothetical protein [Acidovorax sp. SDU_ACID1]|uniref:hypothetical protein n=1 Tax=Acidovorax sp. SDU_ACID1 TaxID=3136632 RepID=UPI0038735795